MECAGIELLVRQSGPADGRPWLFLHAAGETSKAFAGVATALGRRGQTVVVPDMPGCGASEGFSAGQPDIDDYASVIGALLAESPSRSWIVYGRHFGARVAIGLATAKPEAVSCILLDGIGSYSRQERARMRRHAAPLVVPDTDGAYLMTAFQRVRDYALFFPWFDRTAKARRACGLPDPEIMHERLVEVLASSAGIRDAYLAALDYPAEQGLANLQPRLILCRRSDDNVPDPAPALKKLRPDLVTVDLDNGTADEVADQLMRAVSGVVCTAGVAQSG